MTIEPGFGRSIVRGAGLAIGVALVAAVVLIGIAAIDVLVLMFIAVILAAGLEPIIDWLRGRLPIGRGPTILIVYGAFLATVVALAVVIVPTALAQAERVIESVPPVIDQARAWARTLEPAAASRTVTALIDEIARTVQTPGAAQPDLVISIGLTVAQTVMGMLTLLTVVYFWLTEHARLQRYALAFVPKERRTGTHRAWDAAENRLGRWVRGELILMGAIGLGTAVAYTLLGVPAALLLGLFAALAEAIPIVGPLIGAIPAVLVAATVSPQLALTVAGVYLILQIIEGNVLVPIVMRNTIGISPFLVILSVLIGGAAGGFAGALLAVPIAAVGEILVEGFQSREVPVAQDPLAAEALAGRPSGDDEDHAADEADEPAIKSGPTAAPAKSG